MNLAEKRGALRMVEVLTAIAQLRSAQGFDEQYWQHTLADCASNLQQDIDAVERRRARGRTDTHCDPGSERDPSFN